MTLKATLAGITIFVIAAAASVYPEAVTKLYLPQGGSNCRDGSRLLVYGFEFMNRITAVDVSPAAATVFANADQSEVWVFSPCDTHVDIINTVTDRLKRRIDVGLIASDAAFSADGKYCFMTGHTGDYHTTESNIIVVDCETYDVTDTIEAARDPVSVVVTSDAKYLYYPSRSGGSVGKIAIPEFEEIAIIPVGFEPVDLALTADGNYLFVACRGLDSGTRGGTQVSVIDARTDQLCWIFNDLGGSPISLTITPGSAAMIICFADPLPETGENVVLFDLDISADLISLARRTGWSLGRSPTAGFIAPGGDYWFGCDPEGGGLIGIDLTADTAVHLLSGTDKQYPAQVAAVTIDIDESLAILEAEIAAATDSTTLPNSYLDIAYLLQMVGRENDMVAACQRIVDDFPTSFAAVTAQLRLADICYKDRLFSQCANYTRTALHQYR
ncbi:MAG: YncE family protein, partial [candidate division Zixibacteria bacterium]|nr:YncE family protein [candidate division Zixibacteria bacterium]